ncbi:tripartite tricarboxylate transporter TctB family protein [Cryobacterium sp. PH29-G1]|uniref:tripartite tricarboxylate transporter TctB family protein n=1 Tax=Cryobacterium sp. PH29-G1 TaxID=3046211 RepID=UPI0024BA5C31|nr:tripartite tricarboxylate transporter TctB family protein [Cryobacterium sp. PH29-G1]MDJ0350769.1 tripartite tricarboxylate transporter TctB family protein [Cryobacterium sp. PH29-G1]
MVTSILEAGQRLERSEDETLPRRAGLNRLPALVLFIVGVAAMIGAWNLSVGSLQHPQPGLWPFVVSFVIALTGGILTLFPEQIPLEAWNRRSLGVIGGIVSLGVFIILFETIGFIIPAILMLVLWLKVFGGERWIPTIILSIVGSATSYLLFAELLGVPFPQDIVLNALSWIGI